jgi:hypothetical protein
MISLVISTQPNPDLSGSQDTIINLNSGDTLPQDVTLYAYAIDSEDGAASFSYSWHILRKPSSSTADFDDAQIASPTLEGVDVWGDYRIFCIATNTTSGDTSEADPIKAPNSNFCQVRVRSEHLALVKPAAGERDWFLYAYEWVDALEALKPVSDDHEERITIVEARLLADTFDSLSDTNFSNLLDGQVAVFDYANQEWVNTTLSLGAGSVGVGSDGSTHTLAFATQSLNIYGGSNISTSSAESVSSVEVVIDLANTVAISGDFTAGGDINAGTNLDVTDDASVGGDITLTGVLKDSASPNTYLVGKPDGWYESDDGTVGGECKLMTRCTVPGTSTTTRGGVIGSTDKWSGFNSTGKLPSVHILTFSQQSEHTIYTNSVSDGPNIDGNDDTIDASQTGVTQVTPHEHILFYNASGGDISIEDIDIVVMVGGDIQGQPYIWELTAYLTQNDLLTQTRVNTGITVSLNQATIWGPAVGNLASSNILTVPAGGYFGFRCTQSAKVPGHRVIANVTAIRLI